MAASDVCVSMVVCSCILPLWGTIQDQQVGVALVPLNLACEILCVPFEYEFFISYSPLGPLKVSPTGLQSQIFQGHVFPAQDL